MMTNEERLKFDAMAKKFAWGAALDAALIEFIEKATEDAYERGCAAEAHSQISYSTI